MASVTKPKKRRLAVTRELDTADEEARQARELERLLFGAREDFLEEIEAVTTSAVQESGDQEGEILYSVKATRTAGRNREKIISWKESSAEGEGSQATFEQTINKLETPAWVDEEENDLSFDIVSANRLRKLRKDETEVRIAGTEYLGRLRAQHARLNPGTGWASLSCNRDATTPGQANDVDVDDALSAEEALLRSNARLLQASSERLLPGRIELSRLRNANVAEPSKSVVRSVNFHPNQQVLLTAGLDKRIRFFRVDGKENAKIQSVFLEDMPIHKAGFCLDGTQVLAAGRRPWYYVHDLLSGHVSRIRGILGREERSLESFEVSSSKLAAFLCNEGYVSLISLKSRMWVADLKLNGSVRCASFASGDTLLFASGGDGEIYVWDLRTMRCLERKKDEGALNCTSLAVSPDCSYVASGSDSGVVNVYEYDELVNGGSLNPKPKRALMNLTTSIDCLSFSHDSQILGMSSRAKRESLRLVHLPSCTVFANWPTQRVPLHYVQCMDFSGSGGYFCVGNAKGNALLYRLHHYAKAATAHRP